MKKTFLCEVQCPFINFHCNTLNSIYTRMSTSILQATFLSCWTFRIRSTRIVILNASYVRIGFRTLKYCLFTFMSAIRLKTAFLIRCTFRITGTLIEIPEATYIGFRFRTGRCCRFVSKKNIFLVTCWDQFVLFITHSVNFVSGVIKLNIYSYNIPSANCSIATTVNAKTNTNFIVGYSFKVQTLTTDELNRSSNTIHSHVNSTEVNYYDEIRFKN